MASQGLAFVLTLLIGFFLTPFIVRHIGSTANGFLGLASNVTTYASLAVIALNSMAGRFIAMAYFQHNMPEVQKYYSSVFIASIAICLVLSVPAVLLLCFLPSVFRIPEALAGDVTWLFIFTFLQFAIVQIGGAFNNSAYVVNRLELIASRNIESKVLTVGLILLTFRLFKPYLWQIGLIYCIAAIYGVTRNYFIHRRVMPEVRIKRKYFDFAKIRELIASGVWNSISSLGSILLDQLDLLIVNLSISAAAMGIVSVAKIIPLCIAGLVCSLASSAAPALTKDFAEGSLTGISRKVHFDMRLMGFFICLPAAYLTVFGSDFFRLWVPSMDAGELWRIAFASVAFMPATLALNPMGLVFTSANKVKINSLVTIGYALLSLAVMFVLLHFTGHTPAKMLIVVAVSKVFGVLQGCTFTIPYVAKLLGTGTAPFYLILLKNFGVTLLTAASCFFLRKYFPVHSWPAAIGAGILTCAAGSIFGWLILFRRDERLILIDFLKTRLHTGRKK